MLVLLHVACPTDGGLIDVLCQGRQTALPHLTSPEAESILAQACENESNNAKRMRMGLEALSVSSKDINRPYGLLISLVSRPIRETTSHISRNNIQLQTCVKQLSLLYPFICTE